MKKMFIVVRSKLYFIPGMFVIVFSILAILFYYLDFHMQEVMVSKLPAFLLTSRETGSVILSTVTGSLMTMVTIAFSIMMVVLTIYGSQLSPRTLQDFLEQKATLRILGFFMGALVFSVLTLYTIKPGQYDTLIVSPLIGVFLLMIAVVIFAYFIHYISKSVQVSLYIQKLVKETADKIEKKEMPADWFSEVKKGNKEEYADILQNDFYEVKSMSSGFIQLYDEQKLFELAKEENIIICCEKMVGEHVLEDQPLALIMEFGNVENIEGVADKIREMIYIGDETNLYEDIGAGAKKLVEIAVRALSPGINDPATAVFCIEQLGFLLHKVAKGLEIKAYLDEGHHVRLLVEGLSLERLLYSNFYQIKHYGMKDLMILDAILGALITISEGSNMSVKRQVWRFGSYLHEQSNIQGLPEIEQGYIRERIYQLAKATNQKNIIGS